MSDNDQSHNLVQKADNIINVLTNHGFHLPNQAESTDQQILNYEKFQLIKPQPPHKVKQCAGALILNETLTKIVLVKGKIKHKWGPPKGHREELENDLQTMIREINEEISFKVSLKLPLLPYMISNKVKLYCLVIPESTILKITDNEEICQIKWFDLESLQSQIKTYPTNYNSSLRSLFKKADPIKILKHKAKSFYHNYPLTTNRPFNEHLYKLRKHLHELIAFDNQLSPQESNYLYYYIIQRLHNNIFLSTELLKFVENHF
jgi:8-oxo-dGTP pyrophosphatase MutT (NUDIX family)